MIEAVIAGGVALLIYLLCLVLRENGRRVLDLQERLEFAETSRERLLAELARLSGVPQVATPEPDEKPDMRPYARTQDGLVEYGDGKVTDFRGVPPPWEVEQTVSDSMSPDDGTVPAKEM
jgi:hypothetical protein